MGFLKIFKKYPSTFWASNTIELFERWAWYGFYMAFALYLVNSKDTGALGLGIQESPVFSFCTLYQWLFNDKILQHFRADVFRVYLDLCRRSLF